MKQVGAFPRLTDVPVPSRDVRIDCAGLIVEFTTGDPAWSASLRDRFAGFLTAAAPAFTITREGLGERRAALQSASIETMAFGARVDFAAHTAALPADATAAQAGLFMRSLLPSLLTDGLVCHAAALIEGERGWLCCGRSGAGKSTLASLMGERAASDEVGAVRRGGGSFTVHALPFWRAHRAVAQLEGVYLLRHGVRDERRLLTPAAALPALGRHVFWPVDTLHTSQRVFDVLTELVERVPVWELAFRPTPAVWDVIAAPAAPPVPAKAAPWA